MNPNKEHLKRAEGIVIKRGLVHLMPITHKVVIEDIAQALADNEAETWDMAEGIVEEVIEKTFKETDPKEYKKIRGVPNVEFRAFVGQWRVDKNGIKKYFSEALNQARKGDEK